MKLGKGTVKKYSREYHRTLKNGERKKYTTEQIQITVPKNADIYNNKEEVLIIPQSEIEEFYNKCEELESLKIANFLQLQEVENLKELKNNTAPNQDYENLKIKYNTIQEENTSLKDENESIRQSYNKISTKYDKLKQENLNTKTSYAEIYEKKENLEKDYETLRDEYNELVDKYNELEEELYTVKSNETHDKYIANKVKEFILYSED